MSISFRAMRFFRRGSSVALGLVILGSLGHAHGATALPRDTINDARRFVDQGDYDEAAKALSGASSNDDDANLLLAEVALRTGKYKDAADLAKRVTKKDLALSAVCFRAE